MIRFCKEGKTMDVCSELQASVFRKNGWMPMEIECVSVETDENEVAETPEEIEVAEEKQVTLEKQPSKRGRKPTGSK